MFIENPMEERPSSLGSDMCPHPQSDMPLLTELSDFKNELFYKHAAPTALRVSGVGFTLASVGVLC